MTLVGRLFSFSSFKMVFSLTQYRGTVGILNNRLFVRALKYNNFFLISNSQDHCFLDCDFHHKIYILFNLFNAADIKTQNIQKYYILLCIIVLTVAVIVLITTWAYNILISLSGYV